MEWSGMPLVEEPGRSTGDATAGDSIRYSRTGVHLGLVFQRKGVGLADALPAGSVLDDEEGIVARRRRPRDAFDDRRVDDVAPRSRTADTVG